MNAASTPAASGLHPNQILILGLGNDLLGDDSIGLRVARALRARLPDHPPAGAGNAGIPDPTETLPLFEIVESSNAGLALLDEFSGFDEAILIDAVQTGCRPAGYLHQLDSSTLPRLSLGSPHFLGVPETLELGRELGLPMPRHVTLFAVEVMDPFTLSTELSPPVARALPRIIGQIARWLETCAESRRHPQNVHLTPRP